MARRSCMFRDSTSCTSVSAVSMPTPMPRANRRTMALWSIIGRLRKMLQACLLDLPNLITDKPSALHVATPSSASVFGGISSPSGVPQIVKAPGRPFQFGIESADAQPISAAFIRLTIRLCSPTRLSRSRLPGRLASSSFNVGIATTLQ